MHLKEISFDGIRSDLISLLGNCIEFVFQEDDNTFWDFIFYKKKSDTRFGQCGSSLLVNPTISLSLNGCHVNQLLCI